jgi:hypothetical protein
MNRRHEFGLAIAVAALLFSGCTSATATPTGGAVGGGDCRRALPEALRYIPAVP